jgi:hypothetical protein
MFVTSGGTTSVRNGYELATLGRKTVATITVLELSNHGGCRYTYRVSGTRYSEEDSSCGINHAVGSVITITYVPHQPSVSTTGNPTSEFRGSMLFLFGAPTGLAVFAYFGWMRVAAEKSQSRSDDASPDSST